MISGWNESFLKVAGRWGLVLLVVFVLLLLSAFPFKIAHLSEVRPAFLLIAVYYGAVLRPLPFPAVFLAGLALDLLASHPFGMNAFLLVTALWIVGGQRKFLASQPFLVIWAGFAVIALGAGVLQWAFFSLFNAELISVRPMLVSVVLSSFLFPLFALPLSLVHKALADHPSAMP